MIKILCRRLILLPIFLGVSACSTIPYQEQRPLVDSKGVPTDKNTRVHFKVHDNYQTAAPQCLVIMPLEKAIKDDTENKLIITKEQLEQIRMVFYSHLAPAQFRDIELRKVDHLISKMYPEERTNHKKIAEALGCNYLLTGKITDYSKDFFLFYSQIVIGAELQLIQANNDDILWEGKYVAESHASAIPLSPIGAVKGLYDTTNHLSDEEVLKVSDVLARQLVRTIPEPQGQESPQNLDTGYRVIVRHLNIRSGPGKKYGKTGRLSKKDQIFLVDNTNAINSGSWLKIKTIEGHEGYVYKKYIRAEGELVVGNL